MLDFSIIIPIYNAENTLERCLDSICAQTFSNYEVILIDDGSLDSSYRICKKYEANDQRYRVIHQSNNGPSSARNAGLNISKGNWICFVDSDDYIEVSYLQDIFDAIQKYEADVVFIGHNKVCYNGEKRSFIPKEVGDTNYKTFSLLSEKDMFGYTWIKCFQRETIKDIRFDVTLNLFEDEVFACQVIQNCKSVGLVKKPIYNYCIGDGSTLIGRTHEDYCLKCDKVYKAWKIMFAGKQDMQNVLEKKANSYVSRCYYYAFERKVDIRKYFIYLKGTTFFQEHTNLIDLDEAVKTENFKKIILEKIKYQMKVWISSVLHRNKEK